MGTGASIHNPENVGGDNAPNQERKIVRGPVPIEGKPYVYYPSQCSASIRPNNLSAFDDTLLFTSKNRVVFVETGKPRLKNHVFRADGVVYQTKACTLKVTDPKPLRIVVVGHTSGLVLWNFDTQQRIAKHTLSRSEFNDQHVPFVRGICSSHNRIYAGTSTGQIICLTGEAADGIAVVESTLHASEHPIMDVAYFPSASGETHLAVAAADGSISLWSGGAKLHRDTILQPAGPSMPTCFAVVRNQLGKTSSPPLLVAGFSCGHIRVYSTERRELVSEIAAHARPVSSLCASSVRPEVISSGEDSVLNIWKITEENISLEFSELLENTMVVGAVYVGPADDTLAATAFDYEGGFLWKLPSSPKKDGGSSGGAKPKTTESKPEK